MSAKTKSPMAKWLFRAAGSAVVLGLLFWFLPFDDIVDGFLRVSPMLFLLVLAGFLAGHVLAAGKWWLLMGRCLPFGTALRAHFAGLAGNLTLPGVAGGDAVRALMAQAVVKDGGRVVSGALADRLIDMLALACLSVIGVLMLNGAGGSAGVASQVAVLLGVAVVGTFYVLPLLVPKIWNAVPKLPARKLAVGTAESLGVLGKSPALVLGTLLLSILIQAGFVYLAIRLAIAVGVNLPAGAWYFAWPLAKILAVLPISLGGLGVREASLAALLTPMGAIGAQVVAAGLVWQAVLWTTGGLGALILALTGTGLRIAPPEATNLTNESPKL